MSRKGKNIILSFAVPVFLFVSLSPAFAAVGGGGGGGTGGTGGGGVGGGSSDTVKLSNPLGDIDSFPELIKAVLEAAFIIGLPIAVLFIVLAGFRFVWARGNSSQLEKAKHNLLYTVVGIAVFFGAWTLAKIIESTIKALGVGS